MAVCKDYLSCIYSLTWVALIWFIIIPFEIYFTLNIFKYRYHPGSHARHPEVVMGSAIFSMLHQFICETFYYLSSGANIPIFRTPSAPYIASLIFPPLLLAMIIIVIFRVYLVHYNMNLAFIRSTRDWQSLLCDEVSHNDFYSRHHATYGNWRYVSRYFIVFMIIACGCEIGVTVCEHPKILGISHVISQLVYIFWTSICIIIGAVLYINTPKFEDAYCVKTEFKQTLWLGLFCFALYVAMLMVGSETYPICNEIQTSSITVFTFGSVIISEHIILNKIKRKDGSDPALDYMSSKILQELGHKLSRTLSVSFGSKSINGPSSRQLFNVLVASSKSISFYIRHLRSEFCIENLLSFIELIQWLYNVTDGDFQMFDIRPLPDIEFQLSDAIPTPGHNNKESQKYQVIPAPGWNWERSISLIYKKYIASSAEYQVNLPYAIQNAFANLMHLLSIKQATENGTYTFRNAPTIQVPISKTQKSGVRFWDRFSSISNRNRCPGAIPTINPTTAAAIELDEPQDLTVHVSHTSTKSKPNKKIFALQLKTTTPSKHFIHSFRKRWRQTHGNRAATTNTNDDNAKKKTAENANLFPNVSAPADANKADTYTPVAVENRENTLEPATKTHGAQSLHAIDIQKTEILEDEEEEEDVFSLDANEFVILDDDYLCGDGYKNPEIDRDIINLDALNKQVTFDEDTLRSQRSQRSTMRSGTTPIPRAAKVTLSKPDNLSVTSSASKKQNSKQPSVVHMHSLRETFTKISSLFMQHGSTTTQKDNDDDDEFRELPNPEYLKEVKMIERANQVTVFDFVSVTCQALHIILQLNYQSVTRFKRSVHYVRMCNAVNLDQLVRKHGEKGVSGLKV